MLCSQKRNLQVYLRILFQLLLVKLKKLMEKESNAVRNKKPVILTDCKNDVGISELVEKLIHNVLF